jgi:hypothetical protein
MTASLKTMPVDGFNVQTMAAMQYDYIIDSHRFPDRNEQVLARYNEDTATFPGVGELAARGFYVDAIAIGLSHGRFTAEFVAQQVSEVEEGSLGVHAANREFIKLAQGRGRNRLPITLPLLKSVGFDIEVVSDCLETGAIEQEAFDDLVKSVLRRGNVEDANSGLAHLYETEMSDRRERRMAA